MSAFEVEARSPDVTHTARMRKFEDRLRSASERARSMQIVKERAKGRMATQERRRAVGAGQCMGGRKKSLIPRG
jgi:hypothetical protein